MPYMLNSIFTAVRSNSTSSSASLLSADYNIMLSPEQLDCLDKMVKENQPVSKRTHNPATCCVCKMKRKP